MFFSQLVLRVIGEYPAAARYPRRALFASIGQLGLAFTLFAVATLVGLNAVRGVAIPYQKAQRDANTALFGFLEERLAGTEDIRSSGAVDFVLRQLLALQ